MFKCYKGVVKGIWLYPEGESKIKLSYAPFKKKTYGFFQVRWNGKYNVMKRCVVLENGEERQLGADFSSSLIIGKIFLKPITKIIGICTNFQNI